MISLQKLQPTEEENDGSDKTLGIYFSVFYLQKSDVHDHKTRMSQNVFLALSKLGKTATCFPVPSHSEGEFLCTMAWVTEEIVDIKIKRQSSFN